MKSPHWSSRIPQIGLIVPEALVGRPKGTKTRSYSGQVIGTMEVKFSKIAEKNCLHFSDPMETTFMQKTKQGCFKFLFLSTSFQLTSTILFYILSLTCLSFKIDRSFKKCIQAYYLQFIERFSGLCDSFKVYQAQQYHLYFITTSTSFVKYSPPPTSPSSTW